MIELTINGRAVQLEADPAMPLLYALRDLAGLTGTKFGCGIGVCGACTVHVDGRAQQADGVLDGGEPSLGQTPHP